MGIAKIWDIIWDNEPFHWATVIVFGLAIIVEFFTVWQYWHSDCGQTAAAIKFLSDYHKGRTKTLKDKEKYRPWLKKHLGTDDPSKFRKQDDKFLLINYPSVLARPIPRSSLRFVTTLCTAIGVLGTFYGIQDGLQGINLSTQDSKQLMASSTNLLSGMKTAFSTSLMGLGSGSLFTLVLFGSDVFRQKRRDSLRQSLNKIATLETTDNANGEVVAALSRVSNKLTGLNKLSSEAIGQAVGNSIAEQFAGLNQLSANAIGQAVGEQVRSAILPALQAIFREQQQLRQLQENQGQKVLEELIQDLRVQVLEPIAVRLDRSAELTQQASQAVMTLHQELGGISQSLASSILTIQNFQKQTLVELQGFAKNLGLTLNQFQTDTTGVLQQTSLEIHRAVEQSIQGMIAQRSAFQESAEQASATFRGIREELQTALQTRAEVEKQMHQDFANNLGLTLNQFQTDTTGVLQQTSLEIHRAVEQSIQGMIAQRSAFQESAEQASATFRGIREELQTALQTRAEVEQQMLKATQTGIIQILTQANSSFQQQTSTLQAVGVQASGLMNDAKDNLVATLGNIHETLTATRQTVEEDLTKFRQEYQANLQMLFQQQNNLLEETLGEQRDGLARVVTNLDHVFQAEAQRRSQLSEEVDRSMNQIRQAAVEVGRLVNAVGLHDSQRLLQLQELARGIGEQVQKVDNSYRELSSSFSDSLMTWQNHFNESQTHFFDKADSSMARVCDNLLRTAEVLVAANDNGDKGNRRNYHG
ncbi:MAG: hypothetical protein ACSI46_15440 [Gloeotrichia echinulata DVL01]|nr:hypothetical protein [Gloeotrichia echinulata DEX184]